MRQGYSKYKEIKYTLNLCLQSWFKVSKGAFGKTKFCYQIFFTNEILLDEERALSLKVWFKNTIFSTYLYNTFDNEIWFHRLPTQKYIKWRRANINLYLCVHIILFIFMKLTWTFGYLLSHTKEKECDSWHFVILCFTIYPMQCVSSLWQEISKTCGFYRFLL